MEPISAVKLEEGVTVNEEQLDIQECSLEIAMKDEPDVAIKQEELDIEDSSTEFPVKNESSLTTKSEKLDFDGCYLDYPIKEEPVIYEELDIEDSSLEFPVKNELSLATKHEELDIEDCSIEITMKDEPGSGIKHDRFYEGDKPQPGPYSETGTKRKREILHKKLTKGEKMRLEEILDADLEKLIATLDSDDELNRSSSGDESDEDSGGSGDAVFAPTNISTLAPDTAIDRDIPNAVATACPPATPDSPAAPPLPASNPPSQLLTRPSPPTVLQYFYLLATTYFFDFLTRQTEDFAKKILLKNVFPTGRITNWKTLSVGEFKIWFGLLLHMGVIQIPRMNYYWNTGPLFRIPIFGEKMARDRFFGILQRLHFTKNPEKEDPPPSDPLYKIRPLVTFFNERMKEIYRTGKNLSLDKPTVLWRGRLPFRRFIKGKNHKFGIKLYMLTEPSGLVLRFVMYCGSADGGLSGKGRTQKVVDKLPEDFAGRGRSDCYNSGDTAREPLTKKINRTATLSANRKNNPPEIINAKLKKGEVISRWNDDGVCVPKWKDKREVLFVSTEFGPEMVEVRGREKVVKPFMVTQFAPGIDKFDRKMDCCDSEHKTLKWYRMLAIHIFQMMISNAHILYNEFSGQDKLDLFNFRCNLVTELLDISKQIEIPSKSTNRHILKFNDYSKDKKRRKTKRCKNCTEKGKRSQVIYSCKGCPGELGFCLEPCFEEYHVNNKLID